MYNMILKQKRIFKKVKYKRVIILSKSQFICTYYRCRFRSREGCGDDSNYICIICRRVNSNLYGDGEIEKRYYYIYGGKLG